MYVMVHSTAMRWGMVGYEEEERDRWVFPFSSIFLCHINNISFV